MSGFEQSTSLHPAQARTFLCGALRSAGLSGTPSRAQLIAAANALGWACLAGGPQLEPMLGELAAALVLLSFYSRPRGIAQVAA